MNERKLLIVDDEAYIRELLESAFSKAGYTVLSASCGEEALGILGQQLIPVIYIDLGLETMTGFELCERIRTDHPETIIYALTGYSSLFQRSEYLEAGFNEYFAKPVKLGVLYKSAQDAFDEIDRLAKQPAPVVIKRILIIDDDEGFRKMLRQILEAEGYEVAEACDGAAGIKQQISDPADLIITDIIMPKKKGIETMLEIKKTHPNLNFIAVSGGGFYGPEMDLKTAQILGARTLKKPFLRRELLSAIEEIRQPSAQN